MRLVEDGPVRHGVEQRPERLVAAPVVEVVEQPEGGERQGRVFRDPRISTRSFGLLLVTVPTTTNQHRLIKEGHHVLYAFLK